MRKGATTMGTGGSPPPNFWDPSNGVQISENENVRVFTAFHAAKNSAALQPDRPNPRTLGRLENLRNLQLLSPPLVFAAWSRPWVY